MIHQQQLKLNLPTQRDPIARLALCALSGAALFVALAAPGLPADAQAQALVTPQTIVVIATPTLGAPTEAPAPAALQAEPTQVPPTEEPTTEPEPEVIEVQVPVYVEVTAEPPPPTEAPTEAPLDHIIILPSPTQTRQEFIDSFGPTPDPAAKCAFVGCLK